MKKTIYCKPEMEINTLLIEQILVSASGDYNNGEESIGFGGQGGDDDEPAAKGFWDDEY